MPLVFVHGVNNRDNAEYRAAEKDRDGLFRTFALDRIVPDPQKATIINPYWRQYGAGRAHLNLAVHVIKNRVRTEITP